jgi:hypothetical protein
MSRIVVRAGIRVEKGMESVRRLGQFVGACLRQAGSPALVQVHI